MRLTSAAWVFDPYAWCIGFQVCGKQRWGATTHRLVFVYLLPTFGFSFWVETPESPD